MSKRDKSIKYLLTRDNFLNIFLLLFLFLSLTYLVYILCPLHETFHIKIFKLSGEV